MGPDLRAAVSHDPARQQAFVYQLPLFHCCPKSKRGDQLDFRDLVGNSLFAQELPELCSFIEKNMARGIPSSIEDVLPLPVSQDLVLDEQVEDPVKSLVVDQRHSVSLG